MVRIRTESWSGSGPKVGQNPDEKLVRIWTKSWSASGRKVSQDLCQKCAGTRSRPRFAVPGLPRALWLVCRRCLISLLVRWLGRVPSCDSAKGPSGGRRRAISQAVPALISWLRGCLKSFESVLYFLPHFFFFFIFIFSFFFCLFYRFLFF